MNIGSLFLSLGIKSDTKSLEDAIKKVEELKKQTQELNKALKETKANSKLNVSTGSAGSSNVKTLKESQILREEAAVGAAKLRIAKTELGFLDLKEKKESKEEREQKKREKSREKATKDFFNQVESGFSFVAKAFTGGLLAGGIGGYITAQASKQVSLAASLQQYGIDPEKSQRYANVFRRASGGQVGVEETNAFIANLSEQIAQGLTTNPEILSKFAILGIDPSQIKDFDSALKEIREYSKSPNYNPANLTSLLGQLGVPKEFAPAFGKNFSDKEFNDAYQNAKILSNEQVEIAKKLNIQLSELGAAFDRLKGIMLEKFAPSISAIVSKIENNLTSENAEKAAKYTGVAVGGLVATKVAKFAKNNPYFTAGLGAYAATEYLTNGRTTEGVEEFASNPLSSLKEGFKILSGKKEFGGLGKSNRRKSSDFMYPDNATRDLFTRLDQGSVDLSKERDLTFEEEARARAATALNPTTNVNTTVNINAGSVDKNTAPYIANEINGNVNKSLYNSKYPTLSVPK